MSKPPGEQERPAPAADASSEVPAANEALRRKLHDVPDLAGFAEGLFVHSPVPYAVFAAGGACLFVNPAYEAMFTSAPPSAYNLFEDEVVDATGLLPLIRRALAGERVRAPIIWYDPQQLRRVRVTNTRRVAIGCTFFPLGGVPGAATHLAIAYQDVTAELEAQERAQQERAAAQEREELLRFVLKAGGLGHWTLDLGSGRMECSEGFKANFGLPPDADLSSTERMRAFIHPEDVEAIATRLRQAISTRGDYAAEYRVLPQGGGVRWVAARGRVVSTADGEPPRLAGITLDITEQVQARLRSEELATRLDNQQRWLEAILHLTPVPLLLVEPGSGRVTFANRSADAMAGGHFPRHTPVHENNPVYRLTDEWDSPVPNDETPVARAASGERVQGAEWVFHTPAGRFPLLIDSETVPAMAGHPATVVLTLQDVGKLKRAEQRLLLLSDASGVLAESLAVPETALRQLALLAVAYLSDWCVVDLVRQDGGIERVAVAHAEPEQQPQAEQLRGLPPGPNSSPTHLPTRAMREGGAQLIEAVEDAHLVAWAQDAEHLALLRTLGIGSLMSVPMVARGRTLGVVTFSTRKGGTRFDASHLATAEDLAHRAAIALDNARLYHEAQEAVRQRDEFLSVASHELKTPLTPLSLKLQGFARAASAPLDAQLSQRLVRDAEVMRRQVKRLSELVNDLLDVSRISTGQLRLELEPVDLAALVREVAARFEPEAERVGCGLTVTTPSLVTGLWDKLRLDQVVSNLLSNALKYGAGTPVCVYVASDATHVRLRVEDQGIGIPPEAMERIFGRFERAVSTRHYGGLGLGLYVTRQIVERLGGRVGVESQPGRGAAFTVELPLLPPAPPAAPPGT